MTEQYEKGTKAAVDSYTARVELYWKKSIDNRQMLSSDEISTIKLMKKDLIEQNGAGNELVDKIKSILYFNSVLEESEKEDELRREYLALSKRYHAGGLSEEEEKKVVKRINGLAFVLSEH